MILEKVHYSRYFIYLGVAKTYHNLRQYYWLSVMRKDVAYLFRSLSLLLVGKGRAFEALWIASVVSIIEWNCVRIIIYFMNGLPHTSHKSNSVLVIVIN